MVACLQNDGKIAILSPIATSDVYTIRLRVSFSDEKINHICVYVSWIRMDEMAVRTTMMFTYHHSLDADDHFHVRMVVGGQCCVGDGSLSLKSLQSSNKDNLTVLRT